jgi:hypothetical protein
MTSKNHDSNTAPIDFTELVLGFSSTVLYYIGQTTVDGKKVAKLNLPLALQNLQIIELIKEKTKGNLNTDEERLLNEILTDLQKKYANLAD